MKRIVSTACIALLLVAAPTAVLAAGAEPLTLHIEASAQVPPDRVTIPIYLIGQGKDQRAASAELEKKDRDARSSLAALGIDKSRIKSDAKPDIIKPVMAEATGACAAAQAAASAAAAAAEDASDDTAAVAIPECVPLKAITRTLTVELDDPAKAVDVIALGVGNDFRNSRPVYWQSNAPAAHTKARDMAIAKARAEANGYAAALGYHVVGMTRVSNAKPALSMQELIGFFAGIEDRTNRMQPSLFVTTITENVEIDFVLEPN